MTSSTATRYLFFSLGYQRRTVPIPQGPIEPQETDTTPSMHSSSRALVLFRALSPLAVLANVVVGVVAGDRRRVGCHQAIQWRWVLVQLSSGVLQNLRKVRDGVVAKLDLHRQVRRPNVVLHGHHAVVSLPYLEVTLLLLLRKLRPWCAWSAFKEQRFITIPASDFSAYKLSRLSLNQLRSRNWLRNTRKTIPQRIFRRVLLSTISDWIAQTSVHISGATCPGIVTRQGAEIPSRGLLRNFRGTPLRQPCAHGHFGTATYRPSAAGIEITEQKKEELSFTVLT